MTEILPDLSWVQLTVLAFVQGFTEFLPISSSGHLILPSQLFGWPDQGLIFDVAVHAGGLIAVITYFRKDILILFSAWLGSIRRQRNDDASTMAWLILLATLPAGLAGLFLEDLIEQYSRSMLVIGITSIVFAVLLYFADRSSSFSRELTQLTWKSALFIGFAQALAIIPGTSRSGVTMTAALYCNFSREAASRFSFLLAIPIIAASGLLKGSDLLAAGANTGQLLVLLYGAAMSALVAFLCIHFFLRLIAQMGFLPFVIYRLLLGGGLLALYWL